MLTFEKLHGTFMLLCRSSATKRAEVAATAGAGVSLS